MSLTTKQFNSFMRLILSDINEAIEELESGKTDEALERLKKLAENTESSIKD